MCALLSPPRSDPLRNPCGPNHVQVDTAASTRTVRLMADMGLAVAKAIVTRELTAAAAAGGGGTKGGKEGGRARSKPVSQASQGLIAGMHTARTCTASPFAFAVFRT